MLSEVQPRFSGCPSLDRFRRDMDELFDRFFGEFGDRGPTRSSTIWPAVESFRKDGNWVMRLYLPGADPKDIDISVIGNVLTIRASRERNSAEPNHDVATRRLNYGRFERSITLPKEVESDQIKAAYQHGVLEVIIPAWPASAGRKIPIEIGWERKRRLEDQAA